jgi:hypothetical protein
MKNLEISYSLSYSSRDEDTRDTFRDISFNFDNPSVEEVAENINTWLAAIKVPLKVVGV